jgi:hypothetical protein
LTISPIVTLSRCVSGFLTFFFVSFLAAMVLGGGGLG